jgi:hypothetical protein
MCNALAFAMGTTSVIGAAAQGRAAQMQAQQQAQYNFQLATWRNDRYQQAVGYQEELAEWQQENYYKTAISAEGSLQGQYSAVLEQMDQVRDQTLQRIATGSRQAQRASAFIRASASETGTTGASIRLMQQRAELAEARLTHAGFTNLRSAMSQAKRNLAGMQAQAQSAVERAMPGPMAPIDPVQPSQQVVAPSMTPYMIQGMSGALGSMAWAQQMAIMNNDPLTGFPFGPSGPNNWWGGGGSAEGSMPVPWNPNWGEGPPGPTVPWPYEDF